MINKIKSWIRRVWNVMINRSVTKIQPIDLNEFISSALTDICGGVFRAQSAIENDAGKFGHHCKINPSFEVGDQNYTQNGYYYNHDYDERSKSKIKIVTVKFDVCVEIGKSTETSAKIIVHNGLVDLNSSGKSIHSDKNISKLSFEVPISFHPSTR